MTVPEAVQVDFAGTASPTEYETFEIFNRPGFFTEVRDKAREARLNDRSTLYNAFTSEEVKRLEAGEEIDGVRLTSSPFVVPKPITDYRAKILAHDGHPLTRQEYLKRVGEAMLRKLPTIRQVENRTLGWAVLASGPSLNDCVPEILDLKKRGCNIVTVNKSHDWALDHGIVPWAHVTLDSNEWVADYVKRPRNDVRYFVSSQCHPKVFDNLKDRPVFLWHGGQDYPEGSVPFEYLRTYWPKRFPLEAVVFGGTTVGPRVPMMSAYMGPVNPIKFHMFGLDSSSLEPAKMHAMDKKLRPDLGPHDRPIRHGRDMFWFHTNAHMFRQTIDFETLIDEFPQKYRAGLFPKNFELIIHGSGMLPTVAACYGLHADPECNKDPSLVGGYFKRKHIPKYVKGHQEINWGE